jgi:hypothetical protein
VPSPSVRAFVSVRRMPPRPGSFWCFRFLSFVLLDPRPLSLARGSLFANLRPRLVVLVFRLVPSLLFRGLVACLHCSRPFTWICSRLVACLCSRFVACLCSQLVACLCSRLVPVLSACALTACALTACALSACALPALLRAFLCSRLVSSFSVRFHWTFSVFSVWPRSLRSTFVGLPLLSYGYKLF